ncbi:MAG: excinuclease ABC subunit UvrA [Cardiobacteriaceae bacterium]|nr:excinuclease ABC subunit UvrA [Cardiobacteriaceae bacterium]
MSQTTISLRGARTHNLKNIDLDLPRDKFIVITGLSGSGKSSLAFDTIYAEGQRRYVESLSAYARQFLSMMEKPDVDHIEGLSPAISIEQKSTNHNPRSTVGTTTEIHDYLRLLFARVGTAHCPTHRVALDAQTPSQIADNIMNFPEGSRWYLISPYVMGRKGEHQKWLQSMAQQGFVRIWLDGEVHDIEDMPPIDAKKNHDLGVVVDRFSVRDELRERLTASIESALEQNPKFVLLLNMDNPKEQQLFSAQYACPLCDYTLTELEPRLFSFNNPHGACPECDGLGVHELIDPEKVVQPYLSIAGGAIRGWGKNTPFFYPQMQALGKHYGFDVEETPFEQLPQSIKALLLYGSGKEKIPLPSIGGRGKVSMREASYEGIIPNMNRRYRDADNLAVREEMAMYVSQQACHSCAGSRLNTAARHVWIGDMNLPTFNQLSIVDAYAWIKALCLEGNKAQIAEKIVKEIQERLHFLLGVGLDYLTLERSAATLSGGEAQRIRLASQIGAGLVGVMYVLDEPSIGLHQRDNERLLSALLKLRDLGNTIIVVEHDEDAIRAADYLVDMGLGAGIHGGRVIAQGSPQEVSKHPDSITGKYLSGREAITVPSKRQQPTDRWLKLEGASGHNLKNVNLSIPLGLFTCITGVSGSGKSTLINETLANAVSKALNNNHITPAPYEQLRGLEHLDKIIIIDQSPIGRTPRSNPATYTQLFTDIRTLFAGTQEARARGYSAGRFSFNVKGGRCEACQGDGVIKVEMHFLPDIYVHCDQCHGKRYNRDTLDILYNQKNIHDVLSMTVEEALNFFDAIPAIKRKLQTLKEVGLDYLTLGQSALTLSGGEAQRVKLAKELAKRDTGRTLYILDEPTTGLHFHDVKQLLGVLHRLRENGNSVVVIEHNLDVIKTADWIVDLGPEGGKGGGEIVAEGSPEVVAQHPSSHTARFLKPMLQSANKL